MSDSDETVCGNESGEDNTENSPSILIHWRQDKTVFSTEKDEKSLKKRSDKERKKQSNNACEIIVNEASSPEPQISQEFPLVTRGIKRKESFSATGVENSDKNVKGDTNCNSSEKKSLMEVDEIPGMKNKQSLAQGVDDKLKISLKTVEDLVVNMEFTSQLEGNVSNLGNLQNARSQLEDVQKLLIESNRMNQEKRKTILADAENSQQFSEEKKLVIVNLARKQKDLLHAFNKYKDLVKRLKKIKQIDNIGSESSTQISQSQTTTTLRSSVSIQPRGSGRELNNPVQFSEKKSQNSSLLKANVSTSAFKKNPDGSSGKVLSPSSRNPSTTSRSNIFTVPKVVTSTAVNSSSTKAIQQGSVKLILLEDNSSREMSSIPSSQIISQAQTTYSSSLMQSSRRCPTTTNSQSVHSIRSSTTQVTLDKTVPEMCQTAARNVHSSAPKQSQPISTHCVSATEIPSQISSVSTTSYPEIHEATVRPLMVTNHSSSSILNLASTNTRCSTTMKQTPEFSLANLVKKGILVPGKNVLSAQSEGKLYSASLSDKGTIVSAGGEGFTSPRSWMKAILGSKRKVKNELAWRMVSYKNKPLLEHANTLPPERIQQVVTPTNTNLATATQAQRPNNLQHKNTQNNASRKLINSAQSLKILLSNCQVVGVSKNEVFSLENLGENFWDTGDMEFVNEEILKDLEF